MRPYNNGETRISHTSAEIEQLREEFMLWWFDKDRTGTQKEWAEEHKLTAYTISNWKQRPEFIARIEEFRKTYREEGDEALRNLIRFSHSQEARIALPAIKILVEVMGYTSPIKVEVSARGMSLMDYLAHVGQKAIEEVSSQTRIPATTVIEGSFREVVTDPWQTIEEAA